MEDQYPECVRAIAQEDSAALWLSFQQGGSPPSDLLARHENRYVDRLRQMGEELRRYQQKGTSGQQTWKYEEPYLKLRFEGGLLLDLAGCWKSQRALDLVEDFIDLIDPRLRYYRAMSLLHTGRGVAQAELDWIAEHPHQCYWMHDSLIKMNMRDRLPQACQDQAALATGNMVDWLCYPTELGREPDEIELLRVVSKREKIRFLPIGKKHDYFFFRFRITGEHWAKERGWIVGMAGGYPRMPGGTTDHDGSIFSIFESFKEKSIRDHIADYI